MADQRVNGNLVLIGTSGGTIALGSQPSGGGFTILLPTTIPQVGQTLVINSVYNGNTATAQWGVPGSGSVTSVAFTAPDIFFVSGSPITTAGTLALGLSNQNANTFFGGPVSGSAATPTFRAMAVADLPATGTANNTTFLRGDGTWAVVPIIGTFVETFNGRSGTVVSQSGDYTYSQISGTPQLPVQPVVPSHQWLNGYNATTGVFSFSQPASADLSDSSSLARLASPTFTGTVTLPNVSVTGNLTFTTANPTFFSTTGTGAVVLATSPTITSATLAGTTSTTNVSIMGTLADGTASVGTNGQVLTSTVTGVQWANASKPNTFTPITHEYLTGYSSVSNTFSAAQPSVSDLSNGTTGTGAVVLANAPTFTVNPTFASFTGVGAVVLATGPSLTGTTSLVNLSLSGTLADDTSSVGTTGQVLSSTGSGTLWATPTVAFNNVTSGTNTNALTIGNGGLLSFSGSGLVNANEIYGVIVSSTPPGAGQVLTATSSTAAHWTTPSASGSVNNGTAGQLTWYAATGTTVSGNANATISSGTVTLGQVGSVAGGLVLSGTGAGSSVTLTTQPSSFAPWTFTLPTNSGTATYVLETDGAGNTSWVPPTTGGMGSVTVVSSSDFSPLFTTLVTNPTSTPALSFTAITQTQNLVFASPDGSSGVPTFRALVDADLPGGVTGTGAVVLANAPTFTANPTFASQTGSGSVVLAVEPTLTGTTTVSNIDITGTLTDNTSSVGTSGQVLTAGTGGEVVWGAGGGTIGGGIGANQIAFGTSTNNIGGSADFTWTSGVFAATTINTTISAAPSGAPSIVQQDSALVTSVGSYSFPFDSSVTEGNQLMVFVGVDHTLTIPTIMDNQGNTWTQKSTFTGGGPTRRYVLWTSQANSSGTLTVSLMFAATTNAVVFFAEIGGSGGIDQVLTNSGFSTSWSSDTLTTVDNNELLFAFDVAYEPPASLTDSFTELQTQTLPFSGNVQVDMATENAPTVGSYTSSWTQAGSQEWHTVIMSYLPLGGSIALIAANAITTTNTGPNGTVITDTGAGGISITSGVAPNTSGGGIFLTNYGSTATTLALENDDAGGSFVYDGTGYGNSESGVSGGGIGLIATGNANPMASPNFGSGLFFLNGTPSATEFTITSADDTDGTNTTYNGTFPAYSLAGIITTISGFVVNDSNNGTFLVVSNDSATLTVANNAGVAETAAANAGGPDGSGSIWEDQSGGGIQILSSGHPGGSDALADGGIYLYTNAPGGIVGYTVGTGFPGIEFYGNNGEGIRLDTTATTSPYTSGFAGTITVASGEGLFLSNVGSGGTTITDSSGGGIILTDLGGGIGLDSNEDIGINNSGSSGIGISDTGGGGITISNAASSGILSIEDFGSGIEIIEEPFSAGGIHLTNQGTSTLLLDDFGAGISLIEESSGTGGISIANNSTAAGITVTDTGSFGITLNTSTGTGALTISTNGTGSVDINGTTAPITQTIASGTVLIPNGTTITSGSFYQPSSPTATGALSTDNMMADFNSDPTGITGFAPSASGMLTIIKWASADAVNFKVINNTGASITTSADVTLNWRVTR